MVRYIIGIDYGHGETSAACVDLLAATEPINDLIISGHSKKIMSIMAYFERPGKDDALNNLEDWSLDPNWDMLKYALVPQNLNNTIPPVLAYFKGPVSRGRDEGIQILSDDQKNIFGLFCKKVYEEIITNNAFLMPAQYDANGNIEVESNFALYVACPSGWEDSEELGIHQVSDYKAFLHEYGVPCIDVVKESRAAYVSARDSHLKGIKFKDNLGVLIVDYGSSTIDLTWFGNNTAVTDGYELGARNVEEILFDYMINNEELAKISFENVQQYIPNDLLLKKLTQLGLRIEKEKFFDNIVRQGIPELAKVLKPIMLGELIPNEEIDTSDSKYRFAPSHLYNKDTIQDILKTYETNNASLRNETYLDAVQNRLSSFVRKEGVGDIDYVVLTGGASKMPFVPELMKDIFHVDDEHLIIDTVEPSFAISRGTAKYGEKKFNSDPILEIIESNFKKTWGNPAWAEPMLSDIINKSNCSLCENFLMNILEEWTNGNIVADSNHNLTDELKNIIESKPDIKPLSTWYYIQKATPIVNGNHSIHALLTHNFDFVKNANTNRIINDELSRELPSKILNFCLEDSEVGTLNSLLLNYINVYFPGTDDVSKFCNIRINTYITVDFTKEKRQVLLESLITKSYEHVDHFKWGTFNEVTLNRDRKSTGDLASPGRDTLNKIFVDVIKEFSESVVAHYDISETMEACQKFIKEVFTKMKNVCELSTYTIE